MNSIASKIKGILKESTSFMKEIGRLPLSISLLFLIATTAWILFEHAFLPGSPISKDFFWAILSTGILYLLLDYGVSAIRKSESARMDSEKHLSRILETNASGILVMDRTGFVTYANLEAASLLGVLRSDIVGRNYREWTWEITRSDGIPISDEEFPFSQVASTGEAMYGVELGFPRSDGSRAVLSVNVAPLADDEGNVSEMVASFSDVTARREAESLHLRKLHLAAEQSPSAIAITDAAGRIEYANPMFVRVTGFSGTELRGMTKPCPADIAPHECRQICDAIKFGREWNGEYWNRRRNGELYWESARITPIRDPKGRVTHFLWAVQDITEQRLAEDALRETRERYQNLVEKIHDLVWEADQDATFTYVNPRIRDLLGYEPEEIVGKTPFDLMPEFEADRVRELVVPIMAKGLPFEHIENIFRHRDGGHLVFTTSGVPVHGDDGSFRGWRGVSRDITKLKEDEEALRLSEERFRQIFEQNEEAVIIFRSGTAEILDANPAAVALYGYSLDELRQEGPNFIGPGGQLRFFHDIRHISPDNPLEIEGCQHLRKDGTEILVSIRGKSILLQEGQVSYCTFRDITARVRAEEVARAHQAQLIHANRMTSLGTMVSGVAHEINNPNNLIMFNAPMIQSAWKDAEKVLEEYYGENGEFSLGGLPYSEMRKVVPKLIAGMSDSSARIRAIVEKLKNFARRDKENLECRIDLNEVVRTSVSILNHEIARGCRDFRVDLAENLPMVKGCAQQLEQVMVNLIMNALQALPDNHKEIRVLTSVNGETGMVEIRIRDEGIGMSAEVMKHIAEPFFSTKSESGGLGLGLSISASIVRDHNGTLDFESEFGKGTTVRLSFPVFDPAMEDSPKVSVPKYGR